MLARGHVAIFANYRNTRNDSKKVEINMPMLSAYTVSYTHQMCIRDSFLSDAAVGGQAEVGRSTGLGAVAVKKYNALIREVFCDCGTGRCRALDKQVVAAGCVRDGLRFTLVPVSYTHLDVYKRQQQLNVREAVIELCH